MTREVQLRAQPVVGQHQDPLDQHDGGGSDPPGLLPADLRAKVVVRDLHRLPGPRGRAVIDLSSSRPKTRCFEVVTERAAPVCFVLGFGSLRR